jgi:hypothetical protein
VRLPVSHRNSAVVYRHTLRHASNMWREERVQQRERVSSLTEFYEKLSEEFVRQGEGLGGVSAGWLEKC